MKAWVTVRFGTKGARTRWPTDAIEKYAEDNAGSDLRKFKIKDVEREFCRKFPLVGRWRETKGNLGGLNVAGERSHSINSAIAHALWSSKSLCP